MTYTLKLTKAQNKQADAHWLKHGVDKGSMFGQVFPLHWSNHGELNVGIFSPQETRAINAALKALMAKRKAKGKAKKK